MGITQGHEILCCDRNRRGGIKRIWLVEQGNVGAVTFGGANGEIDSLPTAAAYQFEFERGTAGYTANASRENGSTLVNVELEFYVPKITQLINNRLQELTESCGVVAVVESYADDCDAVNAETYFFVLGYDQVFEGAAYLEFLSGEQSTGLGLQDANGTPIKLAGTQAEYPRQLTAAMTAGVSTTDAWTIA